MAHGLNVVVECSFINRPDTVGKEVRSLAKQLEIAAGINRKHASPVRLSFTSFEGRLLEAATGMHAASWRAHRHTAAASEVFRGHPKVTVLSPDAEAALEELEDDRVYVIGGIIDRSVQKNATVYYAHECGYEVRRLPLQEHVEFFGEGQRHSKWFLLNVDEVVLALLEFRRTGDWKIACNAAVPVRKRRLGKH